MTEQTLKDLFKINSDKLTTGNPNGLIDVMTEGKFVEVVSKLIAETNELIKQDLEVTEKLLNERQRLLDAVPECPMHGSCVPHALEWLGKAKSALESVEIYLRNQELSEVGRQVHGKVLETLKNDRDITHLPNCSATDLMEGYKLYECTNCQEQNMKEDNGEITVGYCNKCGHPLWN